MYFAWWFVFCFDSFSERAKVHRSERMANIAKLQNHSTKNRSRIHKHINYINGSGSVLKLHKWCNSRSFVCFSWSSRLLPIGYWGPILRASRLRGPVVSAALRSLGRERVEKAAKGGGRYRAWCFGLPRCRVWVSDPESFETKSTKPLPVLFGCDKNFPRLQEHYPLLFDPFSLRSHLWKPFQTDLTSKTSTQQLQNHQKSNTQLTKKPSCTPKKRPVLLFRSHQQTTL